jgi:hypothetical protein
MLLSWPFLGRLFSTKRSLQCWTDNIESFFPCLTDQVSEDDVLFADELPTFGGTLSLEESEALLSYLTVPYCRVPLVCGFFAARDRSSFLMNGDVQALFTAVWDIFILLTIFFNLVVLLTWELSRNDSLGLS